MTASAESGSDPGLISVPATAMGRRYIEVQADVEHPHVWARGDRTAYQRALAQEDLEDPSALAGDFLESIRQFERYRPRVREAFYDVRPATSLDRWREPGSPNTNRLAARLETHGARSNPPLPEVSYVDRELTPSRTTSPAHFEDGVGTRIILDLLLRTGDQPIVAEVKARGDENTYYALIQALAACAQLAPPAQRARLVEKYPDLAPKGPLQLWIVLASHNSRGRDKGELVTMSRDIAAALLRVDGVADNLSAIACVDAVVPPAGRVQLTEIWKRHAEQP